MDGFVATPSPEVERSLLERDARPRRHTVTTAHDIDCVEPHASDSNVAGYSLGEKSQSYSRSNFGTSKRILAPTWKSWNFTRTLSYWIAIWYLEGSVLFVLGGAFSMTTLGETDIRLSQGLVDGPYFAGGVCFGMGAYCGVLQVCCRWLGKSNLFDVGGYRYACMTCDATLCAMQCFGTF